MIGENILRKHVAIIHAYSMMTLLQRKIFNTLLHEAVKKQKNSIQSESMFVECDMFFSSLVKAINFNSNNTQYLKESIDGLASLKIEWNILKDKVPENLSFLNLRVLHGSPTFFKSGIFNFSFHKLMLQFVGNPEIYGSIDIELQSDFESKFAHSLYENSTRFLNMQRGRIINLNDFRKLLGVDCEKYHTMRELNRNVIKPALQEVNERANFVVNLEGLNEGRKITGFNLNVNPKKQIQLKDSSKTDKKIELLKSEIKKYFGEISAQTQEFMFHKYPEEYIYEKIQYTKEHCRKNNAGLYPIAYLISALKNNYQCNDLGSEGNTEKSVAKNLFSEWNEGFKLISSDLNVWKKKLKEVESENDVRLIKHAKIMVETLEVNLKKHISKKEKFSESQGH